MRSLLLVLSLALSSQAFAETPVFVEQCHTVAVAKLKFRAELRGAVLRPETIQATATDDRGEYKYVWWAAEAQLESGKSIEVSALTQKPQDRPCW